MARYIDAERLLCVLEKNFGHTGGADTLKQLIDNAPTADVVSTKAFEQVKWERDTAIEQLESYGVGFCENKELAEVIRCKDCKFHNTPSCPMLMALNWTDDNDFCSYGERRCT